MSNRTRSRSALHPTLDRRRLLRAAGALGLLAGGAAWLAPARADEPWLRLSAARELLDGAEPRTGALTLELPLVSEDGGAVPLSLSSDADGIEAVHLFASGNPSPEIAVFRPSAALRPLRIATRVRLNRTQSVIALARTADGQWLAASRDVRITVSGCLADGEADAGPGSMQARIRVPDRARSGEAVEALTMIDHPMETGLDPDTSEPVRDERLVRRFELALGDQRLLEAEFFAAVSANPYLRFSFTPPASGELRFSWEADGDRSTRETRSIQVT